jgi:hypothetical protein
LQAAAQHLDQGRRLWQVAPLAGDVVDVDVVLEAKTADHHLEDAHADRVNVLQHQHFHTFVLSQLLGVLQFAEGPVGCLGLQRQRHRVLWCEVSDLELEVVVGDFIWRNREALGLVALCKGPFGNFDFAQIELAVDEFMVVREVHGRHQLDGGVVDHFDVFDGDPLLQVELGDAGVLAVDEGLNFGIHVSTVIGFHELETQRSVCVFELVDAGDDVGVGDHVNPDLQIFLLVNLP